MARKGQIMYMPRDAKVNEAQPKTAEQIFAEKDVKIAALERELAELKEKGRWRSVAKDGWPQTGEVVEFILSSAPVVLCAAQMTDDNEIMNKYALEKFLKKEPLNWRPLDLPEREA